MDSTVQLVTVVIGVIATHGAFAAWIVRHMDRRFDEAKADTQRQLAEARDDTQRQFAEAKADTQHQFTDTKADTQRQFADVQRQFTEAREDNQRQFAELQRQIVELRDDTRRGFEQVREDNLRLDAKLDAHGEQIADLRQDVGRLQGVIERTWEPGRFALGAAPEAEAGRGVREARAGYGAGRGGGSLEPEDEP